MFALEMILKLAAFGLFDYLRNPYNIFDSIIVIIRWQGPWGSAEICTENSTTKLAECFKKDLAATLRGAGLMHKAKDWETKMSFPNVVGAMEATQHFCPLVLSSVEWRQLQLPC